MFCPAEKDYYIAFMVLIIFINLCKVLSILLRLPFFSLRTNIFSFTYAVYDVVLPIGLAGLPFIPFQIQVLLPFSLILFAQLPLRLPRHLITWLLSRLLMPVKSTRSASPDRLVLFASLLSYYRPLLQEIGLQEHPADLNPLLLALVGHMASHCLPNCQVGFRH